MGQLIGRYYRTRHERWQHIAFFIGVLILAMLLGMFIHNFADSLPTAIRLLIAVFWLLAIPYSLLAIVMNFIGWLLGKNRLYEIYEGGFIYDERGLFGRAKQESHTWAEIDHYVVNAYTTHDAASNAGDSGDLIFNLALNIGLAIFTSMSEEKPLQWTLVLAMIDDRKFVLRNYRGDNFARLVNEIIPRLLPGKSLHHNSKFRF